MPAALVASTELLVQTFSTREVLEQASFDLLEAVPIVDLEITKTDGSATAIPGTTVTFRLYHHNLPNTSYQIWLDRNGPQATLLGTFISDAQGHGSLTSTLPATFPLKSEPGYIVQSYPQSGNTPEASTELELILPLALHKTAPATATSAPQTQAVRKLPSAATSARATSIFRPSLIVRSVDQRRSEPVRRSGASANWTVTWHPHAPQVPQK